MKDVRFPAGTWFLDHDKDWRYYSEDTDDTIGYIMYIDHRSGRVYSFPTISSTAGNYLGTIPPGLSNEEAQAWAIAVWRMS